MPSHFVCFQIPASSDHHVTVQIYVIFGHLILLVANVGWLYQNLLAISIKKGHLLSPAAPLSSKYLYRRVKIEGQNKLCRSLIQQQILDLLSVLTCSEMLMLAGFCSPGWNWCPRESFGRTGWHEACRLKSFSREALRCHTGPRRQWTGVKLG